MREEDCESTRGHLGRERHDDPEHARILETELLGPLPAPRTSRWPTAAVVARNTEVDDDDVPQTGRRPGDRPGAGALGAHLRLASAVCARAATARMLATGKLVDQGEAVGIIAAQSIGEPGTQLTMRTFHTGGVAGEDITHGLPRVVELFEARTPKGAALLAESLGRRAHRREREGRADVTIVADDGTEEESRGLAPHSTSCPASPTGSEVRAGDQLTGDAKTPLDPKKILEIKGIRETQQYLDDEVQKVYREQGVSIHDKHVEVIVRQMLRRVGVSEPGDSRVPPRQKADAREFADTNQRLVAEGKQPAEGRPELMGITKASLATESWLSAASFQETTRVLTEAAIEGKSDGLEGLKENVIIGKLIPAGTGMPRYRDIGTDAPDYEPLPFYSSDTDLSRPRPRRLAGRHERRRGRRTGRGARRGRLRARTRDRSRTAER